MTCKISPGISSSSILSESWAASTSETSFSRVSESMTSPGLFTVYESALFWETCYQNFGKSDQSGSNSELTCKSSSSTSSPKSGQHSSDSDNPISSCLMQKLKRSSPISDAKACAGSSVRDSSTIISESDIKFWSGDRGCLC